MKSIRTKLIAVSAVAALSVAAIPAARAHGDAGPIIAGAVIGAVVGGIIAQHSRPPVVYAPPQPVYAPAPRVVYAPAPVYGPVYGPVYRAAPVYYEGRHPGWKHRDHYRHDDDDRGRWGHRGW
jgi:hypothetical protein